MWAVLAAAGIPQQQSCVCLNCNGSALKPATALTRICDNPSLSCSVQRSSGCYGQQTFDSGVLTGTCACSSGSLTSPATYALTGAVSGLCDASSAFVLGCSSNPTIHNELGQSGASPHPGVMSVRIAANGNISFPYRLSEGQYYKIQILREPSHMNCKVFFGTGQVKQSALEAVTFQVVCMPVPLAPPVKLETSSIWVSASCSCLKCNGRGVSEAGVYCSGFSIGCSLGDAGGCYGNASAAGSARTGRCDCGSGELSSPDLYSLAGKIQGLPPMTTLILAAVSTNILGR